MITLLLTATETATLTIPATAMSEIAIETVSVEESTAADPLLDQETGQEEEQVGGAEAGSGLVEATDMRTMVMETGRDPMTMAVDTTET
mmetsp:Transcript_22792/g.33290  ORF Transcript_22792/g.33290 Transcript_22792/m.33290 type:complete len:89 (-) Transcript_22792:3121-3387(-)